MSRAARRRNRQLRKDRWLADRAYLEAYAWAASVAGTPYGVTKPVRTQEELQQLLTSRKAER